MRRFRKRGRGSNMVTATEITAFVYCPETAYHKFVDTSKYGSAFCNRLTPVSVTSVALRLSDFSLLRAVRCESPASVM
jgi:hypothetical protein